MHQPIRGHGVIPLSKGKLLEVIFILFTILKTTHPEKHPNRILQRILVNILERTLLLQLVWPLGDEHFNTLVFKTLIVVCLLFHGIYG